MLAKNKCKKEKNKLNIALCKEDSDNDENEHELSFYINDRVKLMKEVLKIIKAKKIKSMAPDCIKDLDIEEINSMLLEELLGISNKRLKYIFNGQNPSEDSSSTDPEEEKQPIDVISLDDISDDEFCVDLDSDVAKKNKTYRKEELKVKKIKKEKQDKCRKNMKSVKEPLQEENLMSVLELLELQARARAIRSQLMLETNKQPPQQDKNIKVEDSDTDDAVIIELPKTDEIVITSSDSENEKCENIESISTNKQISDGESVKKKIKLVRDRVDVSLTNEASNKSADENEELKQSEKSDNARNNDCPVQAEKETIESIPSTAQEEKKPTESTHDEDEIILIVDQEEMDGIIGE